MKPKLFFFACSSVFSVFLLGMRIVETQKLSYVFLAWNLLLAWMPLLFGLLLEHVSERKGWKLIQFGLLGLWLLFFPNAPYIVTDMLHLHPRDPAPFWFDVCLVAIFAWNGLMLGFSSMRIVHDYFQKQFGKFKATFVVLFAFLLCGFGVYLGRVERWNSWNVVSDPIDLTKNIFHLLLNPFAQPGMIGMTLFFFAFLSLAYFSLTEFTTKTVTHEKDIEKF